jgi:hypothetical protein
MSRRIVRRNYDKFRGERIANRFERTMLLEMKVAELRRLKAKAVAN